MAGIEPTDLPTAAKEQIDLWNESREIANEVGGEIYTRNDPPVIVAGETISSHAYDEMKAERECRSDADRPEHVQQVAATNEVASDIPRGESFENQADVWKDIAERGEGIYRGLHPTMKRDGVYVYGCPHYLVFEDGRPVQVLRLKGTKYIDRPEPFESQLIGPWLTGRILERGQFEVSDLSLTVIRYDRREYTTPKRTLLLSQIQQGYATDGEIDGIDVTDAVSGFDHLQANTYEYESRFSHDSTDFADRLRRSIEILRGERDPLGNLGEI